MKALYRQDGEITHVPRKMVEILNKNFQETLMEDYGPLPFFETKNEKIYIISGDIK